MPDRLVLFGATGGTGSHIQRLALEEGLTVRAYVRSPDKIPEGIRAHANLEITTGDFSDGSAVKAALKGATSVVCAAGDPKASKAGPLMRSLAENIVTGMRTHGVKRFVYQAGAFSPAANAKNPFYLRALLRPVLERVLGISGTLADNDAVIAYLNEVRDVDWTVTRPGVLSEGPSKGVLKVSEGVALGCPFVDLARFTLDLAKGREHVHTWPFVGY